MTRRQRQTTEPPPRKFGAWRKGADQSCPVPYLHIQWATISRDVATGRPQMCLWGDRTSALEGRDADERVCRVRIEVLEVLS